MSGKQLRITVGLVLEVAALALGWVGLPALAAGAGAQTAPLDVVVSEVAWMGTAASAYDEWIELYNNTGNPVDLTGWSLVASGTFTITLSGTIPPGGHFLLERTNDDSVPGVTRDLIYAGGLSNDGADLILSDGAATVIDRVDCDEDEGWFAGHAHVRSRVPMVRVDASADGNLASNWTHNPRCGTATNSAGVSRTCTLTVTALDHGLDYGVYFNARFTATTTTLDHTPMEDALLTLIDGATTSIDAALYGLNRQSVVDALIAAAGDGVTVRVVGDDVAATGPYSSSYQALIDAGITVILDTDPEKLQHNKFLVFDGQVVWTGSTNLTDTGLTLNANNSLVITDTTLAGIYRAEFEEMWAGQFDGDKADNTAHVLDYQGTVVESFFSPTDLVAFEVWEALGTAEESIHFAEFYWTDEVITRRAVERMDAGVAVYGVLDAAGALHPSSAYPVLCQAGARIRVEDFAGKVHHKFAVIDVEGDDPIVILGSYNWTESGAYDNDENTLIIHDRALARAYYAEWQRLWSELDLGSMCNPYTVYLPAVVRGS